MLCAGRPGDVLRAVREGQLLRPGRHRAGRVRVPVAPEAGTQAAWAELQARLRAFVGRRVGDPHAADDLAQEILLRVHQRLGDLRDTDRLDAWAYRIARNAIADHHRVRGSGREIPAGEDVGEIERVEADEPGDAARAELAACLAPLVEQLPAPYRRAIELTDLGDLTQAAAAERLHVSVPGMKARVQRGRRKLRDLLLECCEVAVDVRGRPTDVRAQGACGCGDAGCCAG